MTKPSIMTGLYAIRDTLAETLVGGIHAFKHDAAAVRFFTDVASQADTVVAKHLNDHELIRLGSLDETTGAITPSATELPEVIITGSAWFLSRAEGK